MCGCEKRIEKSELSILGKRGLGATYYIGSDHKTHKFMASYFMSFDTQYYVDKEDLRLKKEIEISYDKKKWYQIYREQIIENGQYMGCYFIKFVSGNDDIIEIDGEPISAGF